MSLNKSSKIVEKYLNELIEPKLGKSKFPTQATKSSSDLNQDGKVDSFEKNVRQLIYDTRHIAKTRLIPLATAFQQRAMKAKKYSPEAIKAAKEKLGIKSTVAEESIFEGDGQEMLPVVIKYKNGTVDRRRIPRAEIARLRAKPTVSSVEITKYGIADRDYDKDGKIESGRAEHAGSVHNAIQRKTGGIPDGNPPKKRLRSYGIKEGFSNWRQDLYEILDDGLDPDEQDMVKEKKVNNYSGKKPVVQLSPTIGVAESAQKLGGKLVEFNDISEEDLLFEKVKKFIHERHLTKRQKRKVETLGKKTGKALTAMKKRYGSKKGESVWYGWKTNVAKKTVKEAAEIKSDKTEAQQSVQDKAQEKLEAKRQRQLALKALKAKTTTMNTLRTAINQGANAGVDV